MPCDRGAHVRKVLLALTVFATAAAGCSSPTSSSGSATGAPIPTQVTVATPDRNIPQVSFSPAPGADAVVPVEILDAVIVDAAARTGAPAGAVTVISARAVTWPDGALGCPQPGFMYTQALEPGYQVVVDAAGTRLDYRTGSTGMPIPCENPPGPG